jgi:hypothetical protein
MFKKILYIVSESQEEKHLVMDLARSGDSAVVLGALFAIGCGTLARTEGRTHERVTKEDRERQCWHDLYELEEGFKAAGIKSTVMAREGGVADIRTLAHNTGSDLIVLSASSLAGTNYRLPDEFLASLPCPIIIVNSTT